MSGGCSRSLNSSPSYKFGTPSTPDSLGGVTDAVDGGIINCGVVDQECRQGARSRDACVPGRNSRLGYDARTLSFSPRGRWCWGGFTQNTRLLCSKSRPSPLRRRRLGIIIDRRCCFARQRCWGNVRLRPAAKAAFLCHRRAMLGIAGSDQRMISPQPPALQVFVGAKTMLFTDMPT